MKIAKFSIDQVKANPNFASRFNTSNLIIAPHCYSEDVFQSSYDMTRSCVSSIVEIISPIINIEEKEHGIVIDELGRIVKHYVGTHSAVGHPRLGKNFSFHHNHPTGATLSVSDVKGLFRDDLFQASACDLGHCYFHMRQKPNYYKVDKSSVFSDLALIAERFENFDLDFNHLSKSVHEFNEYAKEVWTNFANLYGCEYCHREGNLSLINFQRVVENLYKDVELVS